MTKTAPREVWIHALGARIGGGITYLKAVLPELARQLDGRIDRVVVLVPDTFDDIAVPSWMELLPMPGAAASALRRLAFDQLVLPFWVGSRRGRRLFCTGSFSPLLKSVPTVALLRNAIYFDESFLAMELPGRRRSFRLQGALIAHGARGCRTVLYPTQAMRDLVESWWPRLSRSGRVAHYGVARECLDARNGAAGDLYRNHDRTLRFLYVLTYTLQKNVRVLLEALAIARAEGLRVRLTLTSDLRNGHPLCSPGDHALIEKHHLVESGYLELAGSAYGSRLAALYAEADGCVFPSVCESFGNPLVEAMAAGKPLICADRPYARELCGDYAYYIQPDDAESLVALWRQWDQLMTAWRPLPTDEVARRFSWENHVAQVVEALLN